jgi:myotubularin-related protein 1/2
MLTDYRISFRYSKGPLGVKSSNANNPFVNYPKDYFDLPLFFINRIDKNPDKRLTTKYVLDICTKDNRVIRLSFNNDSKKIYGNLAGLCNPKENTLYYTFAIKYREYHPVNYDGWLIYDFTKEFERQGLILQNNQNVEKKLRITKINKNFELCSSYPRDLIVPDFITDEQLKEASTFRTKNRIPALCWYNSDNNTSLWRSSQTKSGVTSQRNKSDEDFLKAIQEMSKINEKLIIYDARPYLNAFANRFKGAGYENTDNYQNTEIRFCEIDNIHCVRNGFIKMNSLCANPKFLENKKFLSILEQTLWNDYIYQILKAAIDIANSLRVLL